MENREYYYEVTLLKSYIGGIICLIIFLVPTLFGAWLMIHFIKTEQLLLSLLFALPFTLLFLALVALSVYTMFYSKTAYISHEGFGVKNRLGHYFLEWKKIEYIEFSASSMMIVGNKTSRFSLPAHVYWGGRAKNSLTEQLKVEVEKHDIKQIPRVSSGIPVFKNCRKQDL